jgi:hypothetical protein
VLERLIYALAAEPKATTSAMASAQLLF